MNIAQSPVHLAERVSRYVSVVSSLSGETLKETLGNVFGKRSPKMIVGGLVRDLARGGIGSRHFDVDVVLNFDEKEVRRIGETLNAIPNRFGGFGIVQKGWKIDFWALSTTWAYREGHASLHYPVDIIDTTFFNVDAVAYDIENEYVHMSDGYLEDLRNGLLEIKLEPNPSIKGNAVRAVRRLMMWQYACGPKLERFLRQNIDDAMFNHIIETERRLYSKSYASLYRSHLELLDSLMSKSKNDLQVEFDI